MSTLKFADVHNLVAFLAKPTECEGFKQIINFLNVSYVKYAFTVNPIVYTSCIEQFWATAKVKNVNGKAHIQALVDKKKVIITEASIRRYLRFEDERRVDCLSNEVIFEQMTLMSEIHNEEGVPTTSNDRLPIGEDRMQLNELMILCTNLQKQVLNLEETKTAQAKEIASLKKRVRKLEQKKKLRTSGLKIFDPCMIHQSCLHQIPQSHIHPFHQRITILGYSLLWHGAARFTRDPEEYEDDETEDGPVDYPMDGRDDEDDDDGDSSRDDADDEDEDEEDGEEEEHLALADFAIIIPTDELVSPPEGTEPRFLAIPTSSPSSLTSLSPPFVGERLARCTSPAACPSPPPVPSPLLPSSGCPTPIQTLRLASTQALIDAVTTAILSPALPLPLYIPPPADRRDDILEIEMPPRKRFCLSTLGSRYEIEESSTGRSTRDQGIDYGFVSTLDAKARRRGIREVRYGIRDTWIDPGETVHEIAPMTMREVNTRVTELVELHEHHTHDLYALPKDAQDSACTRVSALGTPDTATVVRDESHSSHEDNRRNVQTACPCFYTDFMKCQPLNFKGTEGMVGLTRWIKKMEPIFQISGCAIENQVKFTTYTLLDAALTWWNSQIRSLGPDAYSITWEVLKKKMADKYCPQGEIKKLEIKLWNLKVKGNDVPAYTECFQELTLIFTKFVANETKKIDKYVNGLPDNIYRSVKASKPKTLDETIELANDLIDQKLRTYAKRQSNDKRKADDSFRNNHGHQQQPLKRKNVAKVYNMRTGEKKPYNGNLPKANPKGNGYYECGALGNFKRDCPKLKNYGGNVNAQGWVYAVGNSERKWNASRDPDSNVVTGTFLLNNRYESILFNTGADRSFISTTFSSLIDIVPTLLGNSYDVE
nr:hypothetical protein [Tanacetum cinerariifolium]